MVHCIYKKGFSANMTKQEKGMSAFFFLFCGGIQGILSLDSENSMPFSWFCSLGFRTIKRISVHGELNSNSEMRIGFTDMELHETWECSSSLPCSVRSVDDPSKDCRGCRSLGKMVSAYSRKESAIIFSGYADDSSPHTTRIIPHWMRLLVPS